MFDKIYNDEILFSLVRTSCSENNIGASIDACLLDGDGHLLHEKVVVLKLDALYHTKNMRTPPPSPDYLIIVKCCDGSFEGYIVELRNTKNTSEARPSIIAKKFDTAIRDFLENRFRHIFFNGDELIFKKLKLYLVTDPLKLINQNLSEEEYKAKIKGTVLDAYSTLPPLAVGSKICMIEPILPDPTIHCC